MEKTYTISEIARLLKIGTDAIRFYEKKGLVHPQTNPNNQYRIYTIQNILELLDIIYYRHLDMPIADIQSIFTTGSKETMYELMLHKKEETEKRIRYEQQLLKKISYLTALYESVETNENICSMKQFPESIILFESEKKSDFFMHQIQHFTTDQFVLCSLFKEYILESTNIHENKTFITIEKQILEDLKMPFEESSIVRHEQTCIFLLIQMNDSTISMKDIQPLLDYAKEHKYTCEPCIFTREIPLTSYADENNYYAEIYIPIRDYDDIIIR